PLAIFVGAMLGHADSGETILAHTETHLDVGLGWMRHSVRQFITGLIRLLGLPHPPFFIGIHEQFVFVPGHLATAHPERRNLDFVLWAFLRFTAFFGIGAAHEVFTTGNRQHDII